MTFNEFQVQCELYPHSMEHYELVKECAELQLRMLYEETQQFMTESTIPVDSLPANYMMEAASADDLKKNAKQVGERLGKVVQKVWKGILKILRTFAQFIGKLGERAKQYAEKVAEASKKAYEEFKKKQGEKSKKKGSGKQLMLITAKAAENVKKSVDDFFSKGNYIWDISPRQPNLNKLTLFYAGTDQTLDLKYEAALSWIGYSGSDSVAVIQLRENVNGALMNIEDVLTMARLLEDPHSITNAKLDSIQNLMAVNDGKSIKIPVSNEKLVKFRTDLNNAIASMAQAEDKARMGAGQSNEGNIDSGLVKKIPEMYAAVNKIVAEELKAMTAWSYLYNGVYSAYLAGLTGQS